MAETYYPQWRDENAFIGYPFQDSATLIDTGGRLRLTNDWLVDAAIYSAIAIGYVYISRIRVEGNKAFVHLEDSLQQSLGVGEVDRLSSNPIAVRNAENQAVAALVPGESANLVIFSVGDGEFFFTEDATTFVESCVLQAPQETLAGFTAGDSAIVSSNLFFVGEHGVQLTVEETTEVDVNGRAVPVQLIRAHAVGDPQTIIRQCDDPVRQPTQFVREVVFQYGDFTHICTPDRLGNILLLAESQTVVDTVLRINNQPGEIKFEIMGKTI